MDCSSYKVFDSIGICGAGKMGESLYNLLSKHNLNIILYNRSDTRLEKIKKTYEKRISIRKTSDVANKNIIFTNRITDLSDCDIIFEFVSEEPATKKALVEVLMRQRKNPEQIIAIGSSSIVPSKICSHQYLANCAGVHFIYPVQYVKTVEVILNNNITNRIADKLKNFLLSIGKTPVAVKEEVGTFTIKLLTAIQNEAFNLLGIFKVTPNELDKILLKYGLIYPPFELCDSVGADIVYNSIKNLYEATSEFHRYQAFANHLIKMKSQNEKNSKVPFNDSIEKQHNEQFCIPDEEKSTKIHDILILIYINTSLYFLDKGWLDTEELDASMAEINQSATGPITILFNKGCKNVLSALERYSEEYGVQFKPPEILNYIVNFRVGRNEIDRQIRLFKMGGNRPNWHY